VNSNKSNYELPRNIELYLYTLSKIYANEGEKLLQQLIVNSQYRIEEEWNMDNYSNDVTGHALFFDTPESIYLEIIKDQYPIKEKLRTDLNKLNNSRHEFIDEVLFEMKAEVDYDWRTETGVLLTSKHVVLPATIDRIWGQDGFRVFLGHKDSVKEQAGQLKDKLSHFGISGFVAHEDIKPEKEWQDEIENALSTMDAFVAIMTDDFHDSDWTDQEVGFAFGRGVPIISVKLGKDPYGFIGKFQALKCSLDNAALEIVKLWIKHERMLNAYLHALKNCKDFDQGNDLPLIFPYLPELSPSQIKDILDAFNSNQQLQKSYGMYGGWVSRSGKGLPFYLSKWTGLNYIYDKKSGKIILKRNPTIFPR